MDQFYLMPSTYEMQLVLTAYLVVVLEDLLLECGRFPSFMKHIPIPEPGLYVNQLCCTRMFLC